MQFAILIASWIGIVIFLITMSKYECHGLYWWLVNNGLGNVLPTGNKPEDIGPVLCHHMGILGYILWLIDLVLDLEKHFVKSKIQVRSLVYENTFLWLKCFQVLSLWKNYKAGMREIGTIHIFLASEDHSAGNNCNLPIFPASNHVT